MRLITLNKHDHYQGHIYSPIVMIEYGDYQCPRCKEAQSTVKSLQKYFGENLCIAFRHFPLTQIHPVSYAASQAAEVAALYNKFWEMHEQLFENQSSMQNGVEGVLLLGQSIHLSPIQLHKDMKRVEVKKKVEDDYESGIMGGVNRTPTFFINGSRYTGSLETLEMIETIHLLLA